MAMQNSIGCITEQKNKISSSDSDMEIDEELSEVAKIVLHTPVRTRIPVPVKKLVVRPGNVAGGRPPLARKSELPPNPPTGCGKPSITSTQRAVRGPLPWLWNGPSKPGKKQVQAARPSILVPQAATGVSPAALKYKATERIKNLAKHKSIPKTDISPEQLCFSVKPTSLTYKPSLRLQQLAKPRIRVRANN